MKVFDHHGRLDFLKKRYSFYPLFLTSRGSFACPLQCFLQKNDTKNYFSVRKWFTVAILTFTKANYCNCDNLPGVFEYNGHMVFNISLVNLG